MGFLQLGVSPLASQSPALQHLGAENSLANPTPQSAPPLAVHICSQLLSQTMSSFLTPLWQFCEKNPVSHPEAQQSLEKYPQRVPLWLKQHCWLISPERWFLYGREDSVCAKHNRVATKSNDFSMLSTIYLISVSTLSKIKITYWKTMVESNWLISITIILVRVCDISYCQIDHI